MKLYPRLPLAKARGDLADLWPRREEGGFGLPLISLEGERFAPTGGVRVTESELRELRDRILDAVPVGAVRTLEAQQQADRRLTVVLGEAGISPSEGLRPEMWAWLAVKLVPGVVSWRFGSSDKPPVERYAESLHRNALGRLWLRAHTLDLGPDKDDRWSLATSLSEDASVQVLERPTLSAEPRVARAIARVWLRWREKRRIEDVFRDAAKRLLVLSGWRELGAIPEAELERVVEQAFEAGSAVLKSQGG